MILILILISDRLVSSPAINHNTWLLSPNKQTSTTRSVTCLTSVPPSPSPPTPSPLMLSPSPPSRCPSDHPAIKTGDHHQTENK